MQIEKKSQPFFDASKMRVGIVRARFNDDVTSKLLENSLKALADYKVKEKNITVIDVPGAVEIAYALQVLARTKKYDCLVSLGCVISGETDHYEYVCKMTQEGILKVSLDNHIPVGFGILNLRNRNQAEPRLFFGYEAARAALELVLIRDKAKKK